MDAGSEETLEPLVGVQPRRHRRWWWPLGALVVVGSFVGVAAATSGRLRDLPGMIRLTGPAPAFSLPDVRDGRPQVALADFRGRPLVLNFFASWCSPCRRELPGFEAAARSYRGRVGFAGVSFNDERADSARLLDDDGVTYPAGFDRDSTVGNEYALTGLPTTVFISADGRLLERRNGFLSEPQLRAAVSRLFGR